MWWRQRGSEQGCPHSSGAVVQPSGQRLSLPTALSCGKSLPGTHTKVQKQDSGDIHIWGRNVFMGYLDDETTTREKVDRHGWMHTGDLGFLDTEEFLHVLGSARGERAALRLPSASGPHGCRGQWCSWCSARGRRAEVQLGGRVPFVCLGSLGCLRAVRGS